MAHITAAGKLLTDIHHESCRLRDAVAAAAGITSERAAAVMIGTEKLTLLEQLRLSEAAMFLAPHVRRRALALRAQALAVRGFESGDVEVHTGPRVDAWERSAQLRR
jgi:hypothetical protein